MSKPLPPKYQTINWQAYNQSLKQRGQLLLWLDKEMNWLAPATAKRGRQPTFSDAAIQFGLTIKCLFRSGATPSNRHARKYVVPG